jgi:hypothetical protein
MGANLTITARQSEDLYGVLSFNMNSSRWGEPINDFTSLGSWYRNNYPVPVPQPYATADDSGTVSVLVQEAFIDFRVPPKLPIWLRIGNQPFVIRPWLVVNTVGPGLTGRVMIDPIKLGINMGWAKKWEGYDWDCDDVDAFFFDAALPIGPVRVGAFMWYEDHGTYAGVPIAIPPLAAGNLMDDSGARNEAQLYWIGGYADGKIGPVGLQFDFVYGGGQVDEDLTSAFAAATVDQDIRSWVIRGVLNISPIDRLKVGIGGLYATGEDFDPNALGIDEDSEEFMSVNNREGYGRQQGLPALQDFFMVTGGCMGIIPNRYPMVAFFGGPTAIGGLWYVRGFADYMATDWLRLVANFGWLGDTRQDMNKLGNAREAPFAPINLRDDDDIGFELDFGFNIALYKNLQWGVGFSYLWAGDALDQWNGTTGTNDSPNDPWMLLSAIMYTF